jgi:hypothetical protein
MIANIRGYFGAIALLAAVSLVGLCVAVLFPCVLNAETSRRVYFKGSDAELDVYFIRGAGPGPTILLLGGIQGDEPGSYLAADLYADIALKNGNMIVVPRANFVSIVRNQRGVVGDMNRKFDGHLNPSDRDTAVVGMIKELMQQSDFFLNLHDGSGFYSSEWESPLRNPMRFGQSIIADAAEHTRADGTVLDMGGIVRRILEKVNAQIVSPEHVFRFNNHKTVDQDSPHKEQRLSATFHALTRIGIPAFGIETSKNISDLRLRVRYQTTVVNAFLDELGIVVENPKISIETPVLKYLIVSINGSTPVAVKDGDTLEVRRGDSLRIVQVESNYNRGLTARIVGSGRGFNDVHQDLSIEKDTVVEVKKDRFLLARIPVRVGDRRSHSARDVKVEPHVRYFCVRVNNKTLIVEPGEELSVTRGDHLTILDPRTNLSPEREKAMKIDLRGFQAVSLPYTGEDRGTLVDTRSDLQPQYARIRGTSQLYPLQAKLDNKVIAEAHISVDEPKLEYIVLRGGEGVSFAAFAGDKLELPPGAIVRIMDVKTNNSTSAPLFIAMAGQRLRWSESGAAGIDTSKLATKETPLDVTRDGKSIGRIWLKQGTEFKLSSGARQPSAPIMPVRY